MSLKNYHITSHSTGFPSHVGVPAQNLPNLEPIYVIPCTILFQIALLFWYCKLCDLLTDSHHSQCSKCTVSMDSKTGRLRALVARGLKSYSNIKWGGCAWLSELATIIYVENGWSQIGLWPPLHQSCFPPKKWGWASAFFYFFRHPWLTLSHL